MPHLHPGEENPTLDDAVSGVVPASGNLTLSIGPTRARQVWKVTNAAVNASSNTNEPTCVVYQGPAAPSNQLGSTYSGSNDSIPLGITVRKNGYVTAAWTGADVGATVTLSVYGEVVLQ